MTEQTPKKDESEQTPKKDESLDNKLKDEELVAVTIQVGHHEIFLGYERKNKEYKK